MKLVSHIVKEKMEHSVNPNFYKERKLNLYLKPYSKMNFWCNTTQM